MWTLQENILLFSNLAWQKLVWYRAGFSNYVLQGQRRNVTTDLLMALLRMLRNDVSVQSLYVWKEPMASMWDWTENLKLAAF